MTLLAYTPALGAGFMYDDPLDLPRATTRSVLEILANPGASSYYRPLPLLIWHLLHALLGRNDPVLLHGLSLLCHVVSGWLVYQLGRRLLERGTGLVAAALFLWYPPSYQAVGFVNVFFHTLAAAWVLAATVLYWDYRLTHDRRRLVLALVCGALGLLSHESAVTLLPIAVAVELLLVLQGRIHWPGLQPLLFGAEVGVYIVIWLLMPRLPVHSDEGPASIRSNALYFLQGLTTPISAQLGYFPRLGGETTTLLIAGGLTLASLAALLWARRRILVGAFGAIWFVAAVAPPWLLLPWESYVSNAPRLLYLASAGMALIWAAALTPPRGSHRRWPPTSARWFPQVALPTLALAFILATSLRFVHAREAAQTQGAEIVAQVIDTAKQNGPSAHATYVNVPSFLTPREPGFLFGHWGITMVPQYVFELGFVVYVAEAVKPPLSSVAYSVLAQNWEHFFGPHGFEQDLQGLQASFRAGGPVYVTRYEPGRPRLEFVGRLDASAAPPGTHLGRFADWAVLEAAAAQTAGNRLTVRLIWRATGRPPGDYTVFVHILDSSGVPIAQVDGYPIGSMFPPLAWRPGDRVEDVRAVTVAPGATAATVLVGLYDRASPLVRARALGPDGNSLPDNAVRILVDR